MRVPHTYARRVCLALAGVWLATSAFCQTESDTAAGIGLSEPGVGIIAEPSISADVDVEGVVDGTALPDAATTRAALSREIARMRGDIADMQRFRRWQDRLLRIARTDVEEALRQRLPMAECHASALATICDEFWALFQPLPDAGADDAAGQPDQPDREKAP